MSGKLTRERRGRVLLIGLNRPEKRNAFDLELYGLLGIALGELDADAALRCGLLFAHGEHFTGGIDLPHWLPHFQEGRFPALPAGALDPLGLDAARRVSKPLVIAIEGWCLTIGLELLLAADLRVASETARFAMIEVKRGLYPVGGATLRLPREIGWGNAMRYLLTGDEIDAQEAYRLRLVQAVTPRGQAFERALQLAQSIADQSPAGVRATLAACRLAIEGGDQAAVARLMPDFLPVARGPDAEEGLRAFLERRPPRFD